MIIGTAGHIDHGKTALVRALTGVDTDRLPEEKRRGITIELGFAPLHLDGAGTVGIVDVPGHEAFVRTMVAGATGIDVALLVVAADEGVMPQTREHLAILNLLGTRAGVVALTKCDLVDPDWIELVRADVSAALEGSAMHGAAVIPTSTLDGRGLGELRAALGAAVTSVPARDADDSFRMPVDRAFSVRGTGTVVTGTVWGGSIAPGDSAVLAPWGRSVRVRGVQSHGRDVERVGPGNRAAVAVAGVDATDVGRGAWLCGDPGWPPTTLLRTETAMLDDADHVLRPREWVRFHLGTADIGARLVAAGGPLLPGDRRATRVVLQEPVLARVGDRFVLRLASPPRTIGGGVVVDPLPPRRRAKPWTWVPDERSRLERVLAEAGVIGVPSAHLGPRTGLPPSRLALLLSQPDVAVEVSGRFHAHHVLSELRERMVQLVNSFHARTPLALGLPGAGAASTLGMRPDLVERVVSDLVGDGILQRNGAILSRAGWSPLLSDSDQVFRDSLLQSLQSAGQEPPDVAGLTALHHRDPVPILRILEREGLVVSVESERYYAAEAVDQLVHRLGDQMTPGHEYSPAELREILGVSRKYLIPLLEYCDRMRITERRTTGRVLVPSSMA
ncbi:MAG TPA: selenocysteine-specific translation elongation factor [Gemmatimonadaceae bacterium]